MELLILGSGGCQPIPKPCCQCNICREARSKGRPFSRYGPALFVKGINALFDTPEEISVELNNFNIKSVDNVFYTHWHPDHTAGMRVFEQLRLDWLRHSLGKGAGQKKIPVYANKIVWDELDAIKNKFGGDFDYYRSMGIIEKKVLDYKPIKIGNINITGIFRSAKMKSDNVIIYVLEEGNKKVVYAPCDSKPLPEDKRLYNADVLIIWCPFFEGPLKEKFVIGPKSPLRDELFSIEEIIRIIEKYKPKKTILTHIEEAWGKSYSDLKKMEKESLYRKHNIRFAFDGMKIKF
jgi:phosphoribosyl 1,2-cyclic phosphate phosphodiesterase